jgi:hypothetical protein
MSLAGAKRQQNLDKLGFQPNHDIGILLAVLPDSRESRALLRLRPSLAMNPA